MTQTIATATKAWLPEEVLPLIVEPVQAASVAALVSTSKVTSANKLRAPVVKQDPSAAWVAEAEEIPVSQADLDEIEVSFYKVAGLVPVSSELANDSDPDVPEQIGQGLARDISRRVDEAFFGSNTANPKAPAGLGNLTTITELDAPATFADLDPFTAGRFAAAGFGARITAWAANPADAEELAQLKEQNGSVRNLLTYNPNDASVLTLDGVPMFTSTAITAGTVWGIPSDRVIVGINDQVRVDQSKDALFSSDRIAVRAVLRVGFAFTQPQAIVKITKAAA